MIECLRRWLLLARSLCPKEERVGHVSPSAQVPSMQGFQRAFFGFQDAGFEWASSGDDAAGGLTFSLAGARSDGVSPTGLFGYRTVRLLYVVNAEKNSGSS